MVAHVAGLDDEDHVLCDVRRVVADPLEMARDEDQVWKEGKLTMSFTVPLAEPLDPRKETFEVKIYDPEFFIAFDYAKDQPVSVAGAMPAPCRLEVAAVPTDAEIDQIDREIAADVEARCRQLGVIVNVPLPPVLRVTAEFALSGAVQLGSSTRTITVEDDDNSTTDPHTGTISGIIDGTSGLIKNGDGVLVLSGANIYSGSTTVDAELKVGSLEETVTVTGEAPVVDTSTITKQAVAGKIADYLHHRFTQAHEAAGSRNVVNTRSSMSPTIVLDRQGRLVMALAVAASRGRLKAMMPPKADVGSVLQARS